MTLGVDADAVAYGHDDDDGDNNNSQFITIVCYHSDRESFFFYLSVTVSDSLFRRLPREVFTIHCFALFCSVGDGGGWLENSFLSILIKTSSDADTIDEQRSFQTDYTPTNEAF